MCCAGAREASRSREPGLDDSSQPQHGGSLHRAEGAAVGDFDDVMGAHLDPMEGPSGLHDGFYLADPPPDLMVERCFSFFFLLLLVRRSSRSREPCTGYGLSLFARFLRKERPQSRQSIRSPLKMLGSATLKATAMILCKKQSNAIGHARPTR